MDRAFYLTSRSFKIPVTQEEYDNIGDDAISCLEDIPGIYEVYTQDWLPDGPAVYLTIVTDHDYDSTLRKISEVINREGRRK